MKKISQFSLLLVAAMVLFTGCDTAKEAAEQVKDQVENVAEIEFGDFDMKGLQEKLAGITDGFKDVSAENADGLVSKITEFTGSMDGLGIDGLKGPAKDAVVKLISTFGDTIKTALEGISDEGILGKLKPVVEALIEKISAMS